MLMIEKKIKKWDEAKAAERDLARTGYGVWPFNNISKRSHTPFPGPDKSFQLVQNIIKGRKLILQLLHRHTHIYMHTIPHLLQKNI